MTPGSVTAQNPEGSSGTTPEVTTPPQDRAPGKDPLRRSRTGGLFVGLFITAVLLVLLVIFIFQNTQSVHITFLGFGGTAPLSLALVIAAAAGMVIVALVASTRILQLRHRVKREKKMQRL